MNIELLEKVCAIMTKHKLDEVQCEEFTIKKSLHIHQHEAKALTDEEIIDKHTAAPESEPWELIPDSKLQDWSIKGKV
jgi:hypothetical protein